MIPGHLHRGSEYNKSAALRQSGRALADRPTVMTVTAPHRSCLQMRSGAAN